MAKRKPRTANGTALPASFEVPSFKADLEYRRLLEQRQRAAADLRGAETRLAEQVAALRSSATDDAVERYLETGDIQTLMTQARGTTTADLQRTRDLIARLSKATTVLDKKLATAKRRACKRIAKELVPVREDIDDRLRTAFYDFQKIAQQSQTFYCQLNAASIPNTGPCFGSWIAGIVNQKLRPTR